MELEWKKMNLKRESESRLFHATVHPIIKKLTQRFLHETNVTPYPKPCIYQYSIFNLCYCMTSQNSFGS